MTVETRFEGTSIHNELHGQGATGLVFLHGVGGSRYDWRYQVPAFLGDYRVLVVDLWGHGSSPPPENYAVEAVAELVLELTTLTGLERFHLVGHSLGGAVAQEVALARPERVISLTLADTTDWFGDHTGPGGPLRARVPDEREAEMRASMSREVQESTWRALLEWRGSADRAGSIQVPVLVVHGDLDAPKIVEGSERLAERLPHARLMVIEDAGHDPHVEQPSQFNALLRDFFASAGGSSASGLG